ncbi:MAG: hypothetical protein ACRDZ4_03570 [Egibacteraceae bacterium]
MLQYQNAHGIRSIRAVVKEIDFEGGSLHSINDLTNDQIYGLFELAQMLEPSTARRSTCCEATSWSRSSSSRAPAPG